MDAKDNKPWRTREWRDRAAERAWKALDSYSSSNRGRPVTVFTRDGRFVGHWHTLTSAAEALGISVHTISACLCGFRENRKFRFR